MSAKSAAVERVARSEEASVLNNETAIYSVAEQFSASPRTSATAIDMDFFTRLSTSPMTAMASSGGGLFRLSKHTSWVAALTRDLYVL